MALHKVLCNGPLIILNPAVIAPGTRGTRGNRGQEISYLTHPLGETLFEIKSSPFRVFRVFRGLQLPDSGLCHRSVSQLRRRPWRNNRSVRPIVAKRFGVWRLASAMEGFAAWLKAEASLHTPKRFAQIRPLISRIAVNGRYEQTFLSSPGLPAFGAKRCDEPGFRSLMGANWKMKGAGASRPRFVESSC